MSIKFTKEEMLIVTVARQINDHDRLLLGIGLPLVAGVVAKKTHAPNATLILESGVVDFDPLFPLTTIAETTCFKGYSYSTDLFTTFTSIALKGFTDKAILGVGQIDRYGNVNSSFLGEIPSQSQRISGAGGAPEFMSYAKETILTLKGGQFLEKLPYLTSPGYLGGGAERELSGRYANGSGPSCLITPFAVFRFTSDTHELYVDTMFPGVKIEDIKRKIPWEIKISNKLREYVPPNDDELSVLRNFSPQSSFSTKKWSELISLKGSL